MTAGNSLRSSPRTLAVVGGGLIGASWAALFAAHGLTVTAWDPSEAAQSDFLKRVRHARSQLRRIGVTGRGTVRMAGSLADALDGADWIQENAPESVPLKHALYREIEGLSRPRAGWYLAHNLARGLAKRRG